ncbi:histidine kinase [uncultured Azohydromonas sp.]|jgi:Signal transduction histidine kinase|uniref:sensor histidine kinase n=1 Tax=uncultured Azohydromonas sp. TaxID=487342 RepID=UPI00262F32CD|nr:histidine kinase [uncultured Azohydromonas sp.]
MSSAEAELPPSPAVTEARESSLRLPQRSRQALLRHVAGTRALLALSALLTLLPAAPDTLAALLLLGYAAGAALLLGLALRDWPVAQWRLWLWLDALVLLLASRLLAPPIAALMVLPVVALALLSGLRAGLVLALAAAVSLWLVAQGEGSPMALAVPLLLLTLGPAVALLARPGSALRERQRVVAAFTEQADPRHGLRRQVQVLLDLLGTHFGLERALLDLPGPAPRVFCWEPAAGVRVLEDAALQRWRAQRSVLPGSQGCVVSAEPLVSVRAFDLASGAPGAALHPGACRVLLEAGAQGLWMPLHSYGRNQGQLCLLRREPAFTAAELRWLHALMRELLPLLERADLLEQLQEETSSRERERIGRDLHDSAVQPYLGLKYGLEALARIAGEDNPVRPQITQLVQMTNDELQALRDMVSGLRRGQDPGGASAGALAALQRQAQRFESLYGLKVEVQLPEEAPPLRGSLAKALLHLFNEALTNVRRHTQATAVLVQFDVQPQQLCMRVRNDRATSAPALPFTPRSLSERAQEFGGHVTVNQPLGCTEVAVTLPLTG